MKKTLTDAEKTAFEKYNYDDVILYLRQSEVLAKRWQIGAFGVLYITLAGQIDRRDLLALAAAIPNNFTVRDNCEDAETGTAEHGLYLRIMPEPKTSGRHVADWL